MSSSSIFDKEDEKGKKKDKSVSFKKKRKSKLRGDVKKQESFFISDESDLEGMEIMPTDEKGMSKSQKLKIRMK